MTTEQGTVSMLANVLMALNPSLTRHQAYARASRIVEFGTRDGRYPMRLGWTGADYAGMLFTAALTGAKRVKRPTGVR